MLNVRVRHEQSGFTLIEVLVASSLMIVVLGATLTSFNNFLNNNRRNNNQNEQQDFARNAIDQLVKQLRNVANPVNTTSTIALADDNAVIFQTTDPNKQWVGYCLQTSGNGTSPSNGILWYQTYTNGANPNGAPPSTTCPDADPAHGWKPVHLLDHVTNANISGRPVFTYRTFNSSTPMTTPVAATATSTIVRVTARIEIDVEPTKPPAETTLASGAYLRNQNQPPSAAFNALKASGNTYTLDGGAASDPEGRTLVYDWYEGQVPGGSFPPGDPGLLPDCSASNPPAGSGVWTGFKCVGTGPTIVHDFSLSSTAFTTNSVKRVNAWLRVTDPGNLADLTEPTSGGECLLTTEATRLSSQCEGLPISP